MQARRDLTHKGRAACALCSRRRRGAGRRGDQVGRPWSEHPALPFRPARYMCAPRRARTVHQCSSLARMGCGLGQRDRTTPWSCPLQRARRAAWRAAQTAGTGCRRMRPRTSTRSRTSGNACVVRDRREGAGKQRTRVRGREGEAGGLELTLQDPRLNTFPQSVSRNWRR